MQTCESSTLPDQTDKTGGKTGFPGFFPLPGSHLASLQFSMVRLAANLTFLFREVPFLERFSAAARCGFRAVEFLFPYEHDAAVLGAELRRNGLQQALFNAPAGDWDGGERGLGGVPGREADFREGVHRALEYAAELHCPLVHVMAGTRAQGAEEGIFVERLRWAADLAAAAEVRLCIEPLNARDVPGYIVPDTRTAMELLHQIDRPNCSLQLDLYHLQVTEGDLSTRIRALLPSVSHVQIANPPGRHEPGEGEVHFPPLFDLLDSLGYEGFVGCEYHPRHGSTRESLSWASGLLHADA